MKNREEFLDWIIYQIYPRSFKDTNGDGIGDLNGVTEKLDYLQELGVNAVWLCPCYKSPNEDNGYDISNYRDIMDEFGTLEDWKKFASEAHKRGLKVIMDLVANHTSSEHEWFQKARSSKDNPYHDYYYWAQTPPNDWKSVFGGSAWEYNPQTQEYYLHSFAVGQPDLNWENPKVRKEMCDVVDFWVDLGVDGFRCDVLDMIAKDFEKNQNGNGEKLHEYIRELFGREKTEGVFTVGECWGVDEKSVADICGKDRKELTCIFQADHTGIGRKQSDKMWHVAPDLDKQTKAPIIKWQEISLKLDIYCTLFTDNHDNQWYATRIGGEEKLRYERATMLATTFYMLRGIPFIYQGQEIGMVGSNHENIEDFRDVETFKYYNEWKGKIPEEELLDRINWGSRDNARRPFPWTDDKKTHHGFSTATPWIPEHARADEINLEKDLRSEKSVFRFYQSLLKLRRENAVIRRGDFTNLSKEQGQFVYQRALDDETIIVVCNYGEEKAVALPKGKYELLLSNYADRKDEKSAFRPFETAVFRWKPQVEKKL